MVTGSFARRRAFPIAALPLVASLLFMMHPGLQARSHPPATGPRADGPASVRLSGVVRDATTHAPLTGATVSLHELKRGAITHGDGSYAIDGVPQGRYTLSVSEIGYAPFSGTIVLQGDTSRDVELTPRPVAFAGVTVIGEHTGMGLSGSAHAVTEISETELAKQRGENFGEALRNVPGVTLLNTGPSISKPVIRGLHSQRVVIVNAGVQQEGQQWGAEHAPEIDPFAAARIEVLRGAAGVEYGAGAIGGVIRVEPRALPDSAGIGGELSLNGFSNNRQGAASLMLEGAPELLPGVGVRVQASARRAGDASTADYVLGNTGFEELNGSAAIGYHHDNFGTDITASHFGTTLGIYRGSHINNAADLLQAIAAGRPEGTYSFGYAIAAPKQEISHDLLSAEAHYTIPALGRVEAQYGYQYNHRQEFDAHNVRVASDSTTVTSGRASFELGLTTYSAGLKFRHNEVAGLVGTVGVEGTWQENVRGGSIKLIPGFTATSGSVFAIENTQFGDWVLDAGARFDARSLHVEALPSRGIVDGDHVYSSVSGAAGAVYQLSPEWSIGATLGTAWRPPSVNELYSNDVHHGSAQYEIGDPGLANERSISADLTVKQTGERSHAEISIYANTIDGYIYLRPDPTPTVTLRGAYPTFRYRQTNAVLRGIDGTFDYQLTDGLRLGATLSIVRGDDRTGNEPLIQMPGDRLHLDAHLDLPDAASFATGLYVEATGLFVRRQDRFPAGVDYADPPPGYALLNLGAGGRLDLLGQPVVVSVTLDNVLDAAYRDYMSRYRYFADDPGRNLVLHLTLPFGASRR